MLQQELEHLANRNGKSDYVKLEQPKMSWWSYFRRDLERYTKTNAGESVIKIICVEQALWAILQYRVASSICRSNLPWYAKRPLLISCVLWQKLIEILTGICIPYSARIGPGLYIGHYGTIIIHKDVVMGENCNLSQGVTIGVSGRGEKRGVPTIGNRVYLATNAVVVGKIFVGDDVAVAANSLVTRDVPDHTTVMGVPAMIVSENGSEEYIIY